jgi:hypothetical protein
MSDRHEQPKPRRDHRAASDQRRGDDDKLASLLRDADSAAGQDVIAPAELAAMRRTLIAAADVAARSNPWRLWTPRLQTALPVAAAAGATALALWMLGPTLRAPVTPGSPALGSPARQARSSRPAPDAVPEVPGASPSGPARQPSSDSSVAVLPETTVAPPVVGAAESSPAATAAVAPVEPSAAATAAVAPVEPSAAATAAAGPAEPSSATSPAAPPRAAAPSAPILEAASATVRQGDASPPRENTRTVQFVAPGGTRIIWTIDPNFEPPIAGLSARQENGK